MFAQYIFSRISRSALNARKYDVSEKMKHYRSNRINNKMRENLSTRKCHQGLDARKFSCAKISTFTVIKEDLCDILGLLHNILRFCS